MKYIICWFAGHKPIDSIAGFVAFDEVEFQASICKCCNCTIVWDEQLNGWVKW